MTEEVSLAQVVPDSEDSSQKQNQEEKQEEKFDLTIINGAQDFQAGVAYVAVAYKELSRPSSIIEAFNPPSIINVTYLVTSEKLKLHLNTHELFKHRIITERNPYPAVMSWEHEDLEKFLAGDKTCSLSDLFSNVANKFRSHADFNNPAWHDFVALWVIGTYFHRMFPSYPYVHLNGNAGTGKTKCMTLIAALAFNGELGVNSTPSYLIRLVHDSHATTCIDEVEKLQKGRDEESKTILAMLNAGYKRGSFVGKSEQKKQSGGWLLKRFEAYSPKVLAGIQGLPATLASRCVPIIMLRSANSDIVNQEVDENSASLKTIKNNLYRAMLTHYLEIQKPYLELRDKEILGRPWELWRPILALAKCVSEEVYLKMRELAMQIEGQKKEIETEHILTPVILKVLYNLMVNRGEEEAFYATQTIYDFLRSYDSEEFGWLAEDENRSKRGKWLTKQLRLAGAITGNTVQKKVNGSTLKGYVLNRAKLKELLKSHNIFPDEADPNDKPYQSMDELVAGIPF